MSGCHCHFFGSDNVHARARPLHFFTIDLLYTVAVVVTINADTSSVDTIKFQKVHPLLFACVACALCLHSHLHIWVVQYSSNKISLKRYYFRTP